MVEQDRLVGEMPWNMILQICTVLVRTWPEPVELTARSVEFLGTRREFVRTVILMQESGWIMYEALMIGTSPEPCFLGVTITAKGRGKIKHLRAAKP